MYNQFDYRGDNISITQNISYIVTSSRVTLICLYMHTCHVDQHIAPLVRQQTLRAGCAGGQPSS